MHIVHVTHAKSGSLMRPVLFQAGTPRRAILVFKARRPLDAHLDNRRNDMAVDGTWEITINSPMGAQKAKL